MSGRVRVFIACSLDGFIAGPNDDLSWLPQPDPKQPEDYGYNRFFSEIGALLMGRRTYDVACRFGGRWPYADRPVFVASHHPVESKVTTVRGLHGSIGELVQTAKSAARERDVYLDGGDVIRQALEEQLIDDLTVSVVPVVLGRGKPLFAGVQRRTALDLVRTQGFADGLVQLVYAPKRL